jgi:hypothetical protein
LSLRTRVPTAAPLVAHGFPATRPYRLNKGIRAQQEELTATKGATAGTQARVGLFNTNDRHENNKQNVTKNKTEF